MQKKKLRKWTYWDGEVEKLRGERINIFLLTKKQLERICTGNKK